MFRFRALISFLLLLTLVYPTHAQISTNNAVYGRLGVSGVLGKATSVNLNSVADTTVTISVAKYVIRTFRVTNCSATPVLAQIALYTAATAGGVNLVGAAILTTLTSAPIFVDMTLLATTTVRTEATLYIRNAVAQTTALTCDVYIIGDVLP